MRRSEIIEALEEVANKLWEVSEIKVSEVGSSCENLSMQLETLIGALNEHNAKYKAVLREGSNS